MKKGSWVFAALGLLAFSAPSLASTIVYAVLLNGAAEAPPNASTGVGAAVITYDTSTKSLGINVGFSNLTGTTTASHIHCCTTVPFTGTAGVATQTPTFAGFPLGVTGGAYSNSFDMTLAASYNPAFITANGGTVDSARTALLNGLNSGMSYLNIHTSTFGGGEIRGFLVRLTPAETTVPLPAAAWLLVSGVGALGFSSRRRKLRTA
jgi:CHRD domain